MLFFKQKTAYEMRISDWSSDVCSSDLVIAADGLADQPLRALHRAASEDDAAFGAMADLYPLAIGGEDDLMIARHGTAAQGGETDGSPGARAGDAVPAALAMVGQGDAASLRGGFAQDRKSTRLNSSH